MHNSWKSASTGACLAMALLAASVAQAFQVLPKVSDVDRKLSSLGSNWFLDTPSQYFLRYGLKYKKAPVHEAITLAALGCGVDDGDEMECVTKERVEAHRMVLYGVRWPDDPPFVLSAQNPPDTKTCDTRITLRSTSQPACWATLFFDAEDDAKKHKGPGPAFGPGTMLLYRSHFGDLQFMHAMATANAESAGATVQSMKRWARYLWDTAGGSVSTTTYLRDLDGYDLSPWFPGDMTAQNLFAAGIKEPRRHMEEVALGALLHMVQDSFSAAHVERAQAGGESCPSYASAQHPGKILSFRSYVHQKSARHDTADTPNSMEIHSAESVPSAIDSSRVLVDAWRAKQSWADIEPYIDCLFRLDNPQAEAGPGPYG